MDVPNGVGTVLRLGATPPLLTLPFPFLPPLPFPFLFFIFLSPPLFSPFPREPIPPPPEPDRVCGERCELPQLGLGWVVSRQTILCI